MEAEDLKISQLSTRNQIIVVLIYEYLLIYHLPNSMYLTVDLSIRAKILVVQERSLSITSENWIIELQTKPLTALLVAWSLIIQNNYLKIKLFYSSLMYLFKL
jgi:hypothetical protein